MTRPIRTSALVLIASLGLLATESVADEAKRIRIIIDADTANEIDDFYAIVRGLLAPEFRVEGLCSATFGRNPPANNIRASQQFNEEILSHLGLSETVPAPMGSATPMPDKKTPVDSPAARHIIKCARAGRPGNKLWVIATGQCTNLASALLIDPTIKDKVVFAFIDGDFKNGRWGPGIYNWKNDIHAVQAIFESDVEYFHMPAPSVSGQLKMAEAEAKSHLKGRGGIHDYLLNRWNTFRPERKLWTMWDIALVEAILRPGLATAKITGAPIVRGVREVEQFPNNPRRVTVWVDIDEKRMLDDFWRVLDQHAVKTDEKTQTDKEMLQGTWEYVSAIRDGKPYGPPIGVRITFVGDDVTRKIGQKTHRHKFKIAPSGKPRRISLIEMKDGKQRVSTGIYSLGGDTLTWCFSLPGKPIPHTLTSKEGDDLTLCVLKRVRPEKE